MIEEGFVALVIDFAAQAYGRIDAKAVPMKFEDLKADDWSLPWIQLRVALLALIPMCALPRGRQAFARDDIWIIVHNVWCWSYNDPEIVKLCATLTANASPDQVVTRHIIRAEISEDIDRTLTAMSPETYDPKTNCARVVANFAQVQLAVEATLNAVRGLALFSGKTIGHEFNLMHLRVMTVLTRWRNNSHISLYAVLALSALAMDERQCTKFRAAGIRDMMSFFGYDWRKKEQQISGEVLVDASQLLWEKLQGPDTDYGSSIFPFAFCREWQSLNGDEFRLSNVIGYMGLIASHLRMRIDDAQLFRKVYLGQHLHLIKGDDVPKKEDLNEFRRSMRRGEGAPWAKALYDCMKAPANRGDTDKESDSDSD